MPVPKDGQPQHIQANMNTINPNDDFPRIHSNYDFELPAGLPSPVNSPLTSELSRTFAAATGWTLAYQESRQSKARRQQPGLVDSPVSGTLQIDDLSFEWPAGVPTAGRDKCERLVECLDQLLAELQQTRLKLYGAQAELATQIPVAFSPDDSYRIAELLASLLNTSAESMQCERAALYLLDDTTEWLKMRSSIGLDGKHIENDERLLATCVADIEAMAGHAIVVTDPEQGMIWNVPEPCQAAVCVPISSSTTILGTMWVFSDDMRDYSRQEVNILEIIAGRIAAELEREAVIRHSRGVKTESPSATRIECHPVIDPPFDGWSLEGEIGWDGNKFVEWDVTDKEEIRLTIGTSRCDDGVGQNASVFVDPLTGDFQVHGRAAGVSFWLLDRATGVVFDIDEWARPLMLDAGQALIAASTDDPVLARQRLSDFERRRACDGLVLYLNRHEN